MIKRVRRAGIAVAAALLVPVAVGGAQASSEAADGPSTPVASDGSATVTAPSGATGVDANPGTGTPVRDAGTGAADDGAAAAEPAGGGGAESIIGPDERVLVNRTTSFPARAVALVTFSTGGGSSRCSGWMIGADTVATAGHCVAGGASRKFYAASSYTVYPGRSGDASPYGSCAATRLYTVTDWLNRGDERHDYGAIKLDCSIGTTTGWFGFYTQPKPLTGKRSLINGYPGDKPLTQWKSTDAIRVSDDFQLFYQNDTIGGVSGSPVYHKRKAGAARCEGFCAMAIHAYGLHGSAPHAGNNHGTRITQAVFDNLVAWRDAA